MINKIVSILFVALISTFLIGCKPSPGDELFNIKKDMLSIIEAVKDEASADKAADKLVELNKKAMSIREKMSEEEKMEASTAMFGGSSGDRSIARTMMKIESAKQDLFNKDYYTSFNLREIMRQINWY